jgi:O-antigen/teichoic acid export membrane protein
VAGEWTRAGHSHPRRLVTVGVTDEPGRLVRLARVLPAGTASVGGGLVVLGVSSYVFLTLAARTLSPTRFADVSILYVLVYTAGPGVFLPVEQELGRALADRRARGLGGGPVVRRAALLSGGLMALIVVLGLATGPASVPRLFGGSWALLLGLLFATVALWAAHVTRGGLAGLTMFGRYGAQLGLEGASRVVGVAVLAALGVDAVGWWGLLLGGGLLVSVLGTGGAVRPMLEPGPQAEWRELSGALGWLLAGSLLAQLLVNAGPVAARLVSAPGEKAAAGQLLTGLVLARLPLFAFAAVQAALLPGLAAQIASGHAAEFLRGLVRLSAATAVVSGAAALVAGLAGRPLLHAFFGRRYDLGSGLLAELAVGSGLYMLGVIAAQTLVALQRYAAAAAGWAVGVVVFLGTVAVGHDVVTRAVHAFLLGAAAALAASGLLMMRALARWLSTTGHVA